MSRYRTPLSRARGLGAAGHGAGHWISERVSAVALVPLTLWAVWAAIHLATLTRDGAIVWLMEPVNAVLMVLTFLVSFWHMHSGLRVVIEDEKELGVRALLNLGHTFGHALEKDTGYSDRLLHGEGVAIGMVLAHGFSARLGLAPSQDGGRVAQHLKKSGLPTTLSDIPGTLGSTETLMAAIAQDKKVQRGALTFILTRGIGKAFIEKNVDAGAVAAYLDEMR